MLLFKPFEHPALAASGPGELIEQLRLDLSESAAHLRREVRTRDHLLAALEATGNDLAELLDRILGVSPETHFRLVESTWIADSYRCGETATEPLKLLESKAHVHGFEVALDARTVAGEPMTITMTPSDPQAQVTLPADLVAVLGIPWKVMRHREGCWKLLLKVPTREPTCTTVALQRFERAVAHLEQVLGEPPEAFHRSFRSARWRVWARRLAPVAIGVAMLGSLPLIDRFILTDEVSMNPLIFGIPNMLIILFIYISRHEMPTFELPPFPRPLAPDAWVPAAAGRDVAPVATPSEQRADG